MKDKVFKIVTISVVVIIAACCLFPFLHILAISFSNKTAVIRGDVLLWPVNFDLSAYKAVFTNKGLMLAMPPIARISMIAMVSLMQGTVMAVIMRNREQPSTRAAS